MAAIPNGADMLISHMSLHYGGLLDLDSHWGTDSMKHLEHRLGGSADVDQLTPDLKRWLKDVWQADTANWRFAFKEASHLHLRYWKQE